ncbi:hypothetical protein PROFUN_04131 [Planoprotostelium fungivorum]|uniref:Right handed beta helix domain-containing protein n=1 Tax=Planoprotostelium fungivorum TaxID=1890364 RepID=A0A2P6NJL5_9EUKA|nr:hypothetical protein PROFUN_04131 [Planoprotostelium fungivorum]
MGRAACVRGAVNLNFEEEDLLIYRSNNFCGVLGYFFVFCGGISAVDRTSHNHTMRVITNLVFCITLTLACQVYVDGLNGTDGDGCGKEENPCRTIGDHKSVCLAPSGVYTLGKIPAQMWTVDVECSLFGTDDIDGQGLPLIWSHISFQQCQTLFGKNLLNISIETCEFDQCTMNVVGPDVSTISITGNSFSLSVFTVAFNHSAASQPGHIIVRDNHLNISSQIEITTNVTTTSSTPCDISRNIIEGGSGISYKHEGDSITNTTITANRGSNDSGILIFYSRTSEGGVSHFTMNDNEGPLFTFQQEAPGDQIISIRNNTGVWSIGIKASQDSKFIIDHNRMPSLDITVTGCGDSDISLESSYVVTSNQFDRLTLADCTSKNNFHVEDNDLGSLSLSFEILDTDKRSELTGDAVVRQNRMVRGGNTSAISIKNVRSGMITVSNNTITGYSAASGAGAALSIVSAESSITIEYNNMTQNVASLNCGALGVWGYNKRVILRNCTMDGNRAPQTSAFYVTSADSIEVTNNTIRVDAVNSMEEGHTIATSGQPISLYNDVYCPSQMQLRLNFSSSLFSWACSPCQDGSYLLEAGMLRQGQTNHTQCLPCGEHLTCSSGRQPTTRGGYWCGRSLVEEGSLLCFDCPSDYCNRSTHEWNDSCANGRAGVLCGQPSMTALVILSPLLYVVLLTFLPIGDGSVWKSASFFIQTFPLLIPRHMNDWGAFISLVISPGSNDASTKVGFCIGEIDYLQREAWYLYIPIATVLIFAIACIIAKVYNKIRGEEEEREEDTEMTGEDVEEEGKKRSFRSRCSTGMITSCLLVYSGVTSICLKILFCVQIETEEKSGWVMYNAGSIECSGTWRKVLVGVAAVTLLPSPFFILYIRRKLKGRKSQTSRDMLMVLDGCYRNGCKYWETVYMLRKLAIAIIYVLGSYFDWTLSVMRTIIITSLTSHLMLRPFKTEAGQALETVCLLSLTLLSTLDTAEQKSWTIYVEVFLVVIPVLFSLLLAGRKLAVKFMRWLRKRQRNKTERARLLQTEDE